jgi:heat shock protein HslJ
MKAGRLAALVAVALAVAGCGDRGAGQASDAGPAENPLRGKTFLSRTVLENGQPHSLTGNTAIRFAFTDEDRLNVDAGCNTVGGPVRVGGGHLEVTELGSTGIGCDQALHDQDKWLATFLGSKPTWRLDGTDLVLSSPTTELVLTDRTQPDLPLRGTIWTVETIIDGQAAASTPVTADASLVFDQKSVVVQTGCNRGSGDYVLSGNLLRFASIVTTKMACAPDKLQLENAILAVLGEQITYEIDVDQLFLRLPSNTGINLRGHR